MISDNSELQQTFNGVMEDGYEAMPKDRLRWGIVAGAIALGSFVGDIIKDGDFDLDGTVGGTLISLGAVFGAKKAFQLARPVYGPQNPTE